MHAAFKTVSNAIESAMIASLTALMQACKRGAPSAVNKCMRCSQLSSVRSVDHGCWPSGIDTGMRAFFSGQRPGLSSKCSAEVLDGQLVSVVLRSSVKVCVPYSVTTWLWCDLPFIEYLAVELDYGKMSATDLSSFDIAL